MLCKRFTSLSGCNRCERHIIDDEVLTILRPEAIARVCLYICQKECLEVRLIDVSSIRVKCSGIVSFKDLTPDVDNKYRTFKDNVNICGTITTLWCTANPERRSTLEACTLRSVSENIQVISNIHALRQYFICLVKYLRNITICDEMCNCITINKTVSRCRFKLGSCIDIQKITDSIVLLYALRTAVTAHKALLSKDMCIELSDITIACDGTTIIPNKYIYMKNSELYTKKKCAELLSYWIGRHHYHQDARTVMDTKKNCEYSSDYGELVTALTEGIAYIEASTFFRD